MTVHFRQFTLIKLLKISLILLDFQPFIFEFPQYIVFNFNYFFIFLKINLKIIEHLFIKNYFIPTHFILD